MTHSRTRRLAAGSVVMTLLAGLVTLLAMAPAQANHGDLRLEVSREVSSAPTGGTITLIARLVQSNGAPGSTGTGGGVNIDFEAEGGRADAEAGATTRESPDYSCTTAPAALGVAAQCNVTVTNPGSDFGRSFIRAWIDHDGSDATVEADPGEGRLSSATTDCTTELPAPAGTGASNGDDFESCSADTDGAATAGNVAERDNTDVVVVTFFRDAALRLDCAEYTKGPKEDPIDVTCVVTDSDGFRRANQVIDAVHLTGANDPNGNGPDDGDAADYNDGPASNQNGVVILTIPPTSDPGFQTGPAEICAWIDSDADDDNDLGSGTPADDPSYDSAGGPGDGGECDVEASHGSADTANNVTDRIQVDWQTRTPSIIDTAPETSSGTVGSAHVLTAKVFDQFNAEWTQPVQVFFERGSTPALPDGSCTTPGGDVDNPGSCTFPAFSRSSPGTDTICTWFGATPTAACNGETQAAETTDARVDVVTRTWTAADSTTSTTAAPGGGGSGSSAQGYSLVGEDGSLYAYGTAKNVGDMKGKNLNAPIIGVAYTPGGNGYWLVAKDGGIFTFGNADFYGSMGDKTLNRPVIGMAATPTGKGYWLFADDGGIFTFGDAEFFGSMGDKQLNQPVINMEPLESGNGYWLVAADGGIFTFGQAEFFGSMGDKKLNQPVFDMTSTDTDKGYWLVARDGGVFSFGDAEAKFYGNPVNETNPKPSRIIGMDSTPGSLGYWIADANGKVYNYGNAQALGDRFGATNPAPMIGFASVPGQKL